MRFAIVRVEAARFAGAAAAAYMQRLTLWVAAVISASEARAGDGAGATGPAPFVLHAASSKAIAKKTP